MKRITAKAILMYEKRLKEKEKQPATIEKYIRDINFFVVWLGKRKLNKEVVLEYKKEIIEKYAPRSVNSIISSLNSFFDYNGCHELKVRALKLQKQIFAEPQKELTKEEYERLLAVAKQKNNQRLYYLMQTICSTGIRVSELPFITVEAVCIGKAVIHCKGKMRLVLLPKQLCKLLQGYMKENNIKSGSVFVSKNGKPLDRSNIWSDMKKLCESAGVSKEKVFPHNLRHLFARTYYALEKDVVRLADILGHSNVNTTRIYTMETGDIHRDQIQRMGLLRC